MRIGSRGSPLALAQSRLVAAMLARGGDASGFPIEAFTTSGDRIQEGRLLEAGGKGLFTKELDEALLAGRIDAAVHSMKDLPTRLPPGIVLAAVPSREDPRDGFISTRAKNLAGLPEGARLGTASLRRQAQALHARPDLVVEVLRGSVQTRLARVAEGKFDATFLALAGLTRLCLADHVAGAVAVEEMPPAPCQGALAITARADDARTLAGLRAITQPALEIVTAAERAFLAALDGSCRTPIGALARIEGGTLSFIGEVLTPDGKKRWRQIAQAAAEPAAAEALGARLGAEIRAEAGEDFARIAGVQGW